MDGSIIFELLPIPDVISDILMVSELHRLSKQENAGGGGGGGGGVGRIQTSDLFTPSLVFLVLSIIVNALRFAWKLHMEIKDRKDLLISSHYRQNLRITYFLTTLLEDVPQFIITIIYINRQLEVDPYNSLTFAQEFSLIASMATLFTCGLTQEYLNNCTRSSVRDAVCLPRFCCYNTNSDRIYDGCAHLDLALRAIPHAVFYWIFWMLPAAIVTLSSEAILAQYSSIRVLSWVLIGLWTPAAIFMSCCRFDVNDELIVCFLWRRKVEEERQVEQDRQTYPE